MTYREVLEIRRRIPEGGWKNLPGVSLRPSARRDNRPERENGGVLLPLPPEPDPPAGMGPEEGEAITFSGGPLGGKTWTFYGPAFRFPLPEFGGHYYLTEGAAGLTEYRWRNKNGRKPKK